MSVSPAAAVGVGQLLVDDEVLPHRHREQHAKQAGDGEPGERLHGLSVVEKATFGLAASMSNAASTMHMNRLCARGARRLHHVVFPAVVIAEGDPKRQVAEEGATTDTLGPKPSFRTM